MHTLHTLHTNTRCAVPLYLHNGSAVRIALDSARRVRIERKDQPERRIPLHHISRIVCSSTLEISSNLLEACMTDGIPLTWVKPDGSTLGCCIGTRRKENSMRQLLRHALDDPDWQHLYADWLKLQSTAIAAQNLLLCGQATSAQALQNPRAALCNAHYQKHHRPCAKHINALAYLAQQELAANLAKEVGDAQLLAWCLPGLNLMSDLGELIALHAHTDLHHAPKLPEDSLMTPWSIRLYEKHAPHWQQRMGQIMQAFEQFLRNHWQ